MTEKNIEARLVREVRKRGGLTYKFVSPGAAGVPDRIIIAPGGQIWFVELKTDTGHLSRMQTYQIGLLERVGCKVAVTYGLDSVLTLLGVIFGEV